MMGPASDGTEEYWDKGDSNPDDYVEDNDCPYCEGDGCYECDYTGEYDR